MFYINREGPRSGRLWATGALGASRRLVPNLSKARQGVGQSRLSIGRAVACALALAAGGAHAATDWAAIKQRAGEYALQEAQRHFEREAWQRQRAIEQQQYERIDSMEQRQRRDEEQWRQDMLRGGMPPATRYRKPF